MKNTSFLLLFVTWICNVNAQSSSPNIVATAGETFRGSSIQINWTLGELAITTIQNSSHYLTQGFHQSNYMVTSVKKFPQELGEIKVFPNPTTDKISMKLHFDHIRDVKIQLIDLNGSIIWLKNKNGSKVEEEKDLTNLPNGSYFLNFYISGNQYTSTFKIQKIN